MCHTLAIFPHCLLYDSNITATDLSKHYMCSHRATESAGAAHVRMPDSLPQISAPHLQGYDLA